MASGLTDVKTGIFILSKCVIFEVLVRPISVVILDIFYKVFTGELVLCVDDLSIIIFFLS